MRWWPGRSWRTARWTRSTWGLSATPRRARPTRSSRLSPSCCGAPWPPVPPGSRSRSAHWGRTSDDRAPRGAAPLRGRRQAACGRDGRRDGRPRAGARRRRGAQLGGRAGGRGAAAAPGRLPGPPAGRPAAQARAAARARAQGEAAGGADPGGARRLLGAARRGDRRLGARRQPLHRLQLPEQGERGPRRRLTGTARRPCNQKFSTNC
ncbi:hypothetical protein SBRY_60212 [Actinacidiphila bryophytorum]|uniref:Uncharacterized protein n=1 Tax=Actinacidiphila bryophytorum TaxID=1436133 RepID=A0A9W4H607_9ACTN|nr:hypothetical protein SBRY_60212 [Actinacidiphila bryophytorum]